MNFRICLPVSQKSVLGSWVGFCGILGERGKSCILTSLTPAAHKGSSRLVGSQQCVLVHCIGLVKFIPKSGSYFYSVIKGGINFDFLIVCINTNDFIH